MCEIIEAISLIHKTEGFRLAEPGILPILYLILGKAHNTYLLCRKILSEKMKTYLAQHIFTDMSRHPTDRAHFER